MNPKIERHEIPLYSKEWFDFRMNGIGSSEVGDFIGWTEREWRKSKIRMFYEKIGVSEQIHIPRPTTFWGSYLEEKIMEIWQYWDGTEEGYIDNYEKGNKFRRLRRYNGYAVNPDYPWLFVTPDRLMNIGQQNMITGENTTKECPIEGKTTHAMERSKWASGIPPQHLLQVHSQMIVLETDYAEIATFDNLRAFDVFPLELHEGTAKMIIEKTRRFWEDVILPGKELMKKYGQIDLDNTPPDIQKLEPEADDSDDCRVFMNERYAAREDEEVIAGDQDDWEIVQKALLLQQVQKLCDPQIDLFKNQIREKMQAASVMNFDDAGKITNRFNKNGNKVLRIDGIEDKPVERAKKEFSKIKLQG